MSSPLPPTAATRRRRSSRVRRSALLPALLATAALALSGCDAAGAPPLEDRPADAGLQRIADQLVDAGYPAAVVTRTDPDGTPLTVTAGSSRLDSDVPVPSDAEVRIGSASKTFTAVVVLQLVQEGRLGLDDTVETLLPGTVEGDGVDPASITVRQLLQHTSGLPEYADLIAADAFAVRDVYRSPRDMLDLALERPASSAPGERYEYSNTGYLVLGLIIERITQRPLAEAIDRRIVEPLGLRHTYLPAPGERSLRGEHPSGYHVDADGELRDLTDADPSWTWAAGAMVSTTAELNTFMRAVLAGELVDAPRLDEMLTGIPTGEELLPGSTYGLGIESIELSCGTAWGHSGDIPGYQTRNAVAEDGTALTVTVTALPWAIFDGPEEELLEKYLVVIDTLETGLCADDR